MQSHLETQNQITPPKSPPDTVVAEWKKKCKKARDDVLELDATAKSRASTSSPTVFGKTNLPQPDLSAQIAQVNASMQGVQIAQLALDNAEEAYQAAVDKQEANAKVMSNIQAQLKKLQKTGKTLEEIKKILRDCVVVLVDLIREINKLRGLLHYASHCHRPPCDAACKGFCE